MNRTLIALGVAATVILPTVAQAAPKIYGRLNISAEQFEKEFENPATKPDEFTRVVSNASRFGVKGEDELTATLAAVYAIEWEVAGDGEDLTGIAGSTKADLIQRNRFVGIKSQSLGTIKLGKFDTYLKSAQGETDLFNDFEGDFKYVIAGENRINNTIGYESPSFAGVTVNVQTQTQDGSSTSGNAQNRKNGSSASIVYSNEELGLYTALAADFGIDGSTALFGTRESDNVRAVVSFKIADLTLNGTYQTSDAVLPAATSQEETGWNVGASYKIGDEVIKAQYGLAEADDSTAANLEHTLWSVGYDHNFTSKTRAFVWYTVKEEDKLVALGDSEIRVAAVGIDHKF